MPDYLQNKPLISISHKGVVYIESEGYHLLSTVVVTVVVV